MAAAHRYLRQMSTFSLGEAVTAESGWPTRSALPGVRRPRAAVRVRSRSEVGAVDEPRVIRLPGIGFRIERDELRRRTREVDDGPLGGEGEDARCYKRAQCGLIRMGRSRRLPWWIARGGAANPAEHDR